MDPLTIIMTSLIPVRRKKNIKVAVRNRLNTDIKMHMGASGKTCLSLECLKSVINPINLIGSSYLCKPHDI